MRLALMLLLLAAGNARAADSTLVRFMHSVHKSVIDTSYRYYYVLDEATDPRQCVHISSIVYSHDKDFPVAEFLSAPQIATFSWRSLGIVLPKVLYVSKSGLPSYNCCTRTIKLVARGAPTGLVDSLKRSGVIPVMIKCNESKTRIKKLQRRALASYEDRPKEEKNYYIISAPIFSVDKKFALIQIDELGHGGTYIFRNLNGKWVIVYQGNWIA